MNEEDRQNEVIKGHKDIVDAIRKLEERISNVETLMDEIKPYIQGVAGLGVLSKAFYAMGGIAVAWLAVKGLFHP